MVGQRIVNPWPQVASGFDPLLLHHKQTTWMPVKRDWGKSRLFTYGFNATVVEWYTQQT